jgi:hypothetical protein
MVFAHPTRRSDDDRRVDRFTRRETPAQRRRRIARTRIDVPEEVVREFEASLTEDTARQARAIAQALTHTPTETTMSTTKRYARTRKAELTPAAPTAKPEPAAKVKKTAKAKPKPKAAAKATARTAAPTSERTKANAKYTEQKLKVQAKFKVNAVMTYHGRVSDLDGQRVKIVGHEGRGGIFVEYKGDRYIVSPFALEKKADVEKK